MNLVEFMKDTNEFKLLYGSEYPCYTKPGARLVDIATGDLSLLL